MLVLRPVGGGRWAVARRENAGGDVDSVGASGPQSRSRLKRRQ